MRQARRSLSFLAACARQQKSLAAAVEVAVAQPGGTALPPTATAAAGLPAPATPQHSYVRTIAVSAATRQAVGDLPDKGDSYYWLPPAEEQQLPFTFDRRGIHERRATSKLESAIESVLLADGYLREHLVEKHGFSVHRVRFSKDRRTAYILWDANAGQAQACQRALDKNAFRLRSDLARNMKSKHTPYLEFRHDHLPPLQAATAAAIEAAEQELAKATAAERRQRAAAAPAALASVAAAAAAAAAGSQQEATTVAAAPGTAATAAASDVELAAFADAEWDLQAAAASAGDVSTSNDAAVMQGNSPAHGAASAGEGAAGDPGAEVSAKVDGDVGIFAQQDLDAAIARLEVAVSKRRRPGR